MSKAQPVKPPRDRTTPWAQARMSVADAAAQAGVTPQTIRMYIAKGQLTGYRIGPKLLRVDRAEFARFVDAKGLGQARPHLAEAQ